MIHSVSLHVHIRRNMTHMVFHREHGIQCIRFQKVGLASRVGISLDTRLIQIIMADPEIKLSLVILKEVYGDTIHKIGKYLTEKDASPLRLIARGTGLRLTVVRKCLAVMIHKNISTFSANKHNQVLYKLDHKQVIHHSRFPQFIYTAKVLYGDGGEMIVEELLHHGRMDMAYCISRVMKRLKETTSAGDSLAVEDVHQTFALMVQTHFLRRVPGLDSDKDNSLVPNFLPEGPDAFALPHINLAGLRGQTEEPPAKRARVDPAPGEQAVMWRVNVDRFLAYFRDQTIVSAVQNRIDQRAGEVMRSFLRCNETISNGHVASTPPLSANEAYSKLPAELLMSKANMDHYLSLITDPAIGFMTKMGDSSGGSYVINLKASLRQVCESHLESVVQERFGYKGLRIFRTLLIKRHLEQKQIEEFAMIPAKESKEMLYEMFRQNFLTWTEVPKTPDHAPSRTFYLFSVNVEEVARMVRDMSYKALHNLMLRRIHETKENKRLLEKQQRVTAIAASLEDETQRQEVEDMITPAERTQLDRVKHMTNKLEQAELQLDDTICLLETYLEYAHVS